MSVHENERVIVLRGRKIKIKKFDALTGSYIALKIGSKISHIALGITSGALADPAIIGTALISELGTLSKGEFNELQNECLNVCFVVDVVGDKAIETPIRINGAWAISGVENDVLFVMTVIAHVLLLNLSGFFDGNALKESAESFTGLLSFDVKTLMSSPLPQ